MGRRRGTRGARAASGRARGNAGPANGPANGPVGDPARDPANDPAHAPGAAPSANGTSTDGATAGEATADAAPLWIEGLAKVLRAGRGAGRPNARTSLRCDVGGDRPRLFVPPEMPELQPASLAWLSRFAAGNGFALVEDRRGRSEGVVVERRGAVPPAVGLGLALLLRQTGLPGPVARLSEPHRHAPDGPFLDLPELVAMAASAARRSKRVSVLPSRPLVDLLGGDTHPVQGYACRLDCAPARTVLSHFDAPNLRCIGYSTGRQYVVHLLLGGGPVAAPRLWTRPAALARTDVRFRLFRGPTPRTDFGLLYSTLYFDMTGQRPAPWWLREQAFTDAAPARAAAPVELALAG